MEYYKIIYNDAIIGAASSKQFARYSPVNECLLYCSKSQGQYIICNEGIFRDSWMKPISASIDYVEASIIPIEKEEFDIIIEALKTEQEIIVTPDEPVVEEPQEETPDITVEYIRGVKLKEMSATCRQIIEAGFDLELRGETHHFSLDTQDQLNLISLSAMAQTQSLIPYHADGEACIFYTNEEINQIVESATAFKIYHTTYYNALKGYINSLDDINTIAAVQYGIEIPEEYQSDVLKALQA